MSSLPLDDAIWSRVSWILNPEPRATLFGRKPLDDRAVLAGILLVLETGMPWERLPVALGFGSGMTCLRRLRRWQREGKWAALRDVLLAHLPRAERIAWWRAEAGGAAVRLAMRRQVGARVPRQIARLRLVSSYH